MDEPSVALRRSMSPDGPVPVLTRQQAERIRMQQADPDSLRVWLARAGRVKAPSPPATGPLGPNDSGWLLARGSTQDRLLPGFTRWMEGGSLIGIVVAAAAKGLLRLSPLIALAAFAFCLGAAYGSRQLLTRRRLGRWRKLAAALPARPRGEPTLVRVTGTIARQPTLTTLFRGQAAVLFRSRMGQADETRGMDFEIRAQDGRYLTVDPRFALLLDEPTPVKQPPACGPVWVLASKQQSRLHSSLLAPAPAWARWQRLYESSVGPGDTVEIIGHLLHDPPRLLLRGSDEAPLQIRRVAG